MNLPTSSTLERPLSAPHHTSNARTTRRLAPGLEIRLRRLEERRREQDRRHQPIGRIPEEQIQELERFQRRQQNLNAQRGGGDGAQARAGLSVTAMPPSGGVRLSGGPVLTDNEASMLESDVSSVIDISDHFGPSETEDEFQDHHKYRMPPIGKTRLNLLTKEPLSPKEKPLPALPAVGAQSSSRKSSSTPTTPRTADSTANTHSPGKMDFNPFLQHSSSENVGDGDSIRASLSRAGSIYTLGRASFSGQLLQLTNMRLPEANSLAKKISLIPTSTEAAKSLSDASEQIRLWISKASDVLGGLNAEDDVEWAAAGGREGIDDVDRAINRFERLVEVYISSIEKLQKRSDVGQLPGDELVAVVKQMESIMTSWQNIRDTLKDVKYQVEIAMEWEQLWNSVLGEAGQEMDSLNRMVFEMEEKRHEGAEGLLTAKDSMNLDELETIIEEEAGRSTRSDRGSLAMTAAGSPLQTQTGVDNREGSSVLALLARMEPLRASLDFLPMQLSSWKVRGNAIFPSACLDLEGRREQLEAQWSKLQADADSLRREISEDQYVHVFRSASRKAYNMVNSIYRSFEKLKEGIDADEQQSNFTLLAKKIENYELKKSNYAPSVDRVLAIIDQGVLRKMTVNGEILRLQSELKTSWRSLQTKIKDMDKIVEEIHDDNREKELRDSLSTVLSSGRSVASSLGETPGSSPASSVIGLSRKSSFQGTRTPKPVVNIKTRSSSSTVSASSVPRKPAPRYSGATTLAVSPATDSPARPVAWPSRPEHNPGDRPRWKTGVTNEMRDFRPLSALEPSPYAKAPVTPTAGYLRSTSHPASVPSQIPSIRTTDHDSKTPARSSIPRPTPRTVPTRVSSLPVSSPTPVRNTSRAVAPQNTTSPLTSKVSTTSLRPASRLSSTSNGRRTTSNVLPSVPIDGNEADSESPSYHRRSPSVMGGKKNTVLPPRAQSRLADRNVSVDQKPKWRV